MGKYMYGKRRSVALTWYYSICCKLNHIFTKLKTNPVAFLSIRAVQESISMLNPFSSGWVEIEKKKNMSDLDLI